ncbi:MAG: hypothetical protein IPO52_15375 [Gemmatimonadetes bacterium]|nr:hypothetical protein [Gemmatimonadota bacterium]
MKPLLTSWLSSLGVGAVTAIVGAACGVWIATLAVTWQPTPNRGSGSAYAVYYAGLLAAAAGGIIGLVVSRWLAQAGDVPMVRAALTATAIHVALLGVIGSVMRLMSDVPPTFEGEKLLLAVELSWPEAAAPPIPSGDAPPHMALAIAGASSVLDSRPGILFAEDARREGGRYIVPGVVEVWTERKARILSVNTGTLGTDVAEFEVPLPRRPGAAQRAWSEWLPVDGGSLQYRFRVVKRNEPARTQVVGPFTIGTLISQIDAGYSENAGMWLTVQAHFAVTHNGTAVRVSGPVHERDNFDGTTPPRDSIEAYDTIEAVAIVPGATPGLVVQVSAPRVSGYTYLLRSTGTGVQYAYLSHRDVGQPLAHAVTPPDTTATPMPSPRVEGLVDELLFRTPGLYVAASAVLDTRTLEVHRVPLVRLVSDLDKKAPLSLSPDEQRYVRITKSDTVPVLQEITIATGATRDVPLQFAASPTGDYVDVDAAWFDHYFAWEADAAGQRRVVPRPAAAAMPHRGKLTQRPDSRLYAIDGVKEGLHDALVAFLVTSLQGTRGKHIQEEGHRSTEVVIGTDTVTVSFSNDLLSVYAPSGANTLIIVKIARKFDEALATRRYDQYFGP